MQLNLSQRVSDWGSAYLNGYQQDYWDMDGHERSVSAGFSSSWRDITVDKLQPDPHARCRYRPANGVDGQHSVIKVAAEFWATYSANTSSGGFVSHQVGLGGTALEDNKLSYNLQQTYANQIRVTAAACPGVIAGLPVR